MRRWSPVWKIKLVFKLCHIFGLILTQLQDLFITVAHPWPMARIMLTLFSHVLANAMQPLQLWNITIWLNKYLHTHPISHIGSSYFDQTSCFSGWCKKKTWAEHIRLLKYRCWPCCRWEYKAIKLWSKHMDINASYMLSKSI